MSPISDQDADQLGKKHRPRGSFPWLPADLTEDSARAWLTPVLVQGDWTVHGFERAGREGSDPCWLTVTRGRERRTFRINRQADLMRNPRTVLASISNGLLGRRHLTGSEAEDVWVALCFLGNVLTEHDEREEARKWIEQMVPETRLFDGHTLVPDGRHAALMAVKHAGEFMRPQALTLLKSNDGYCHRPIRFLDCQTGEQWLRAGETGAFIRYVLGVEPLSPGYLKARLSEIGVVHRPFEDYRPPHPKLRMYQLTEELIEGAEDDQ